MSALGRHILVEFMGCKPEILNDAAEIESAMVAAAEKAGATVINSTFHHFSPYGVSGVVVIQESHLAIHTWPEYQYAAVDLFTCGGQVDPWISFDFLKAAFKSSNYSALEMLRGSTKLLQSVDFDLTSMREDVKKHVNPDKFTRNVWFTDKDENQALSLRYTGEILFKKESPYQLVQILDTYAYGKMLTIDNMVMCTEKDEFHYHEMITHPAMQSHKNVKNVLIIGGGDGGTVREILKYENVEKVTMVEIDEVVIAACKEHLPTIAASFDHPKLELIIGDGIDFVSKAENESYDLIIIDGSDPVGPATGLFSETFFKNCHRALKSDGILTAQGESPAFNEEVFTALNHLLKDIFGKEKAKCLLFNIATYPTGVWSIHYASKGNIDPEHDVEKQTVEAFVKNKGLKYYNYGVHNGAFSLPTYLKQILNEPVTV